MTRPRKLTIAHIEDGTMNVTRHGKCERGSGKPDFRTLPSTADSMRHFAASLPWVKSSDVAACHILGQLWQDWLDSREDGKPAYPVLDRWLRVAGTLGLTPVQREQLRAVAQETPEDDLERMLG